jgi:hypothetical protein
MGRSWAGFSRLENPGFFGTTQPVKCSGLARRRSEMADPAADVTGDGVGWRGGG